MSEGQKCCTCSSPHHQCTNCKCKKAGKPCDNCRKGENCQNPYGNTQFHLPARVANPRPPADDPQRNRVNDHVVQRNEREREEAERDDDPRDPGLHRNEAEGDERQQEEIPRDQQVDMLLRWKGLEGEEAERWVEDTYKEVVTWSSANMFDPPMCTATKDLIREMTSLINNYIVDSNLAQLAFRILFLMPKLLLQRTHENAKGRENTAALGRRMALWQRGEINELLAEAREIQRRTLVRKNKPMHLEDNARLFGNKMRAGKVSAATRSLSKEDANGVLPINRETIRILRDKHPQANIHEGIRLQGEYVPPNAVIFERITGDMIWKKAVKTKGGAGPSGLNANGWRILLSTAKFKEIAQGLRNAIACLTKKLATSTCHYTQALTANQLVPFKKIPDGCRPIGIGEVLRRIIGKSIMEVVKDDVRTAVGNLQVCAGQRAGCEAAIHAMRAIYAQPECEGVLLVDATNAFNSLNRKATVHNTKILCPSIAQYVENTYKEPTHLYMATRNNRQLANIIAEEGTTQGDPIAMAMYALGLSALLEEIKYETTEIKNVAFADDLTGAGKIEKLKAWWDLISTRGSQVGYLPNARKSFLIVKPEHFEHAKEIFADSEVVVSKEGQRHLGAAIGTEEFKDKFVKEKVNEWVEEIKMLSNYAKTEPHASYTAFTHGVKHQWNYLLRTIPDVGHLMQPLERAIKDSFIPALMKGHQLSDSERAILALPPRMGGLGIINPVEMAATEHQNSIRLTAALTEKIVAQNAEEDIDHNELIPIRQTIEKERHQKQQEKLQQLIPQLSNNLQRKLHIAQEVGASNWLTTLPLQAKGFALNKQEFCDALALRYGWPVEGLPEDCGCGEDYNMNHAMICKLGGYVCNRHDEVRDLTVKMLKEVCVEVTSEPMLLRIEGEQLQYATANRSAEARVDFSARGFWTRGQRAYGDIRIFDPMAASHIQLSLDAAHKRNQDEKLRAYGERIQNIDRGSFTPLVFTTSGGMGPMAKMFYSRLAEIMAERKQQAKSFVTAWMRCRLSFSLLRSAIHCLRGTRSSIQRPIHVENNDFEAIIAESRIDMRLT